MLAATTEDTLSNHVADVRQPGVRAVRANGSANGTPWKPAKRRFPTSTRRTSSQVATLATRTGPRGQFSCEQGEQIVGLSGGNDTVAGRIVATRTSATTAG